MTELSKNTQVPQCDKTAVSGCVLGLPEIGKTYNCFDDGKIRESRRYEVTVKEIIPFKEIDKDILEQWCEEVKRYYWLYADKTDYFIKTWNGDDVETFIRTKNNEWFSMGFMCSGILDIDGSLTESLPT
jgi:hypothetical protein